MTVLFAWALLATESKAEASSRLSSRFLARGEQALLEIAVTGVQPDVFPETPVLKDVEILQASRKARKQLLPGRRPEYCFDYLVSSYATGSHVLPPIEVMAGGVKIMTEPLEFKVFNPDELEWSEAETEGTRIRYASVIRCMNSRPYEGETTPVEIKIFVPRDLVIEDWGIPDFQRDGVTSWRFQPSAMRGDVNLLGRSYKSVAYPSTLTATRAGKVGIGPAAIRLMTTQVVMDGILRRVSQELNLTVPRLELESVSLPKGAPEGFENAVGSFKLEVRTSALAAQEGDPIPVDILVSGRGNLDTLHVPRPVDAAGWKLYEATTEPRGDERRELAGTMVFHQFMRPLVLKTAVPPFRLVYFDPMDALYKTLTSEPIPLKMTPAPTPKVDSTTPPAALAMPIERMTDILGVVRTGQTSVPGALRVPVWVGHALGGLCALVLLAKALWLRYGKRFRKDAARDARRRELREMERVPEGDGSGFLLLAGRFIERWLGENPAPEVRVVLAERDGVCFRPDMPDKVVLETKRRDAILKLLRKAAMVIVAGCLLGGGIGQARAADLSAGALEAYDSARYDEAIKLWLQGGRYEDLTTDTLYNIGNACYRAGSPGQAALYYRRALARDPGHQESRQNLRFIERKCGAITVFRPEYQYVLARLSLHVWQGLFWTGVWLCGLAVLVFPAFRAGSRVRVAAVGALLAGPLLVATGALGWRYFPNDAEFAALGRQAVIVSDNAVLHADAARTSPEVIDAPAGSLCEVIHETGRWAYVAFATRTRGWIPVEAIEKVVPATPPVAPTIRKPKADGKSA
jgi:hypothetical protein